MFSSDGMKSVCRACSSGYLLSVSRIFLNIIRYLYHFHSNTILSDTQTNVFDLTYGELKIDFLVI